MLKKIATLYPNSLLSATQPNLSFEDYYVFFDEASGNWLGIPKINICDSELNILKVLYQLAEFPSVSYAPETKIWHDFLLANGPIPHRHRESDYRFIQFHLNEGTEAEQTEIESALKGFFTEEVMIVWENLNAGFVIEEKNAITLSEKDIISMSDTLESDFYIKVSFYVGKHYPLSEELRLHFKQEREYFHFGQKHLFNINILTFERVFPVYVSSQLPKELSERLGTAVTHIFEEDADMFSTIKAFLENNLNASVTAKKLYIHRNTLQYRIDKFVEKTGIDLKDFYGAFTVFLACLLYEQELK